MSSLLVHLGSVLADVLAPSPTGRPGNGGYGGLNNPPPQAPDGLSVIAEQWISWAKWGCLLCGALGFLVCGAMMTVGRRNRSHLAGEGAAGIPWTIAGLSLGALAVPLAIEIMSASGSGG